MDIRQYLIIFYVFFWVVRINGCFRRGRQPLLRGPQWFFDVRVSPDFYTGSGRKILHRYWLRMLLPFALDIPVAAVIFLSGQLQFLNWLILALCAVIHLNHSFSVDLAERQARHLALPEADLPVATVALSLTPRRLRDYTNRNLEWALALSCVGGFSWLLRYYFASPHHHNLRLLFGLPVYFLYLQLGLLLVKCIVVAWRSPIPQAHAAEHLAAREETRKYYLRVCDWHRLGLTAAILFWPVKLSYSALHANRLFASTGRPWEAA